MFSTRLKAIREQAARPTRELLQSDQARSGKARVRALIGYFEKNLFNSQANANSGYKQLKILDNNFSTEFRSSIGKPPGTYLRNLRLEVAARLLCFPRILVSHVGELVGYNSNRSFTAAFKSWSGLNPTEFRKEASTLRDLAIEAEESQLSEKLSGKLRAEARQTLLEWLGQECPAFLRLLASEQAESNNHHEAIFLPPDLLTDDVVSELSIVQDLWDEIADLPFEDQAQNIAQQRNLSSPALFYFLREASRIAARRDRARCLDLAKLALVGARVIELPSPNTDGKGILQSQAYTWLGNQLRLSLNFLEAEKAFSAASWFLPSNSPPLAKGELVFYRARLHWYRCEYDDAFKAVDEAISIFEAARLVNLLNEARILRGILFLFNGAPAYGIEEFRTALGSLDPRHSPFQCFSAYYNLARALIELKRYEESLDYLQKAVRFVRSNQLGDFPTALMIGLQGHAALEIGKLKAAEPLLAESRRQFLRMEYYQHAAVVSVDLAALCIRDGRTSEAALLAAEIVPLFGRLPFHEDAIQASHLLHEAVKSSGVTVEVIEQVRELLKRLRTADPTIGSDSGPIAEQHRDGVT